MNNINQWSLTCKC